MGLYRTVFAISIMLVVVPIVPQARAQEVVVVNALEQVENLKDLPKSVSAFTGEQLTEHNALHARFLFDNSNRYGVQEVDGHAMRQASTASWPYRLVPAKPASCVELVVYRSKVRRDLQSRASG